MKPFCIFDIETTGLDDFGHVLAVTVGEVTFTDNGVKVKPTTFMLNDYPGETQYDDSKLLEVAINELKKYACVIGWYSKGFDVKFLRRRLLDHRMPDWQPNLHVDLYFIYSHNFKTGHMSCRLAAASEFLNLDEPKMIINRKTWKSSWYGEQAAMAKIKKRCESDVKITGEVFGILLPYLKSTSFKSNV